MVVLEGLVIIAKLIYRFSVFEDYYLHGQPPLPEELQKGIKGPLVSLYGCMALFLLEAQIYFKHDAASKQERLQSYIHADAGHSSLNEGTFCHG